MARLECARRSADGVTLVELRLASDVPERVAVEPTHEGPVWPPRRQGVPEAGWSADGWTGIVPADEPLALGYATPGDPDDPPARIADTQPAAAESGPATPRDVLRALGDPRPPRDAVQPTVDAEPPNDEPKIGRPDAEGASTDRPRDELDAIAARLDRAETLARIGSVDEAREAVAAAGGMDAVGDLAGQLARDRDRLAALQDRAAALRERADVDVPVEHLERLV